jgi:hypothetical protein
MRIVGHNDLGGAGDGMHINIRDGIAYIGHMGQSRVGTSVVDVSDPTAPRLLNQLETPVGTHSHKVQVLDDVLVVNYERNAFERDAPGWQAGLKTFDISDPSNPVPLGFLPMAGKGVHRMTYWQAPYVLMSGSDDGYTDQFLIIADLSDPSQPTEVARWWFPGMHTAGGEVPQWDPARVYKAHHAIVRGDRAYCTWWDAGFMILDISTIEDPKLVTHHFFGGDSFTTHTAMPVPGKDLLIVVEESVKDDCAETRKNVRIVDISDEEKPAVVSVFPVPGGDFCSRGGRFGPHNIHEARPGTLIDPDTVYLTYFNAGVRVFDITDPASPAERGYCIPEPPPGQPSIQMNDITVDVDGTIYATDRIGGGLYVLEYDAGS